MIYYLQCGLTFLRSLLWTLTLWTSSLWTPTLLHLLFCNFGNFYCFLRINAYRGIWQFLRIRDVSYDDEFRSCRLCL